MKSTICGTCRVILFVTLIVAGILIVAACRSFVKIPAPTADKISANSIYAIGHRGAAGLTPENTMASFAQVCDIGVDAVELDVLLTADGQIVVYHDYQLNPEITRSPTGEWIDNVSPPVVNELKMVDIRGYDVGRLKPGSRYSRRYPDQIPADGERIPTLSEVIGLLRVRCDPTTQLWVEIKTSPEKPDLTPPPEIVSETVVRVLREENFENRARILSFDWRNLIHVQKIAPKIPTVYLSSEGLRFNTVKAGQPDASPWMAGLDIDDFLGSLPHAVHATGGVYWAPHYRDLTGRRLKAAHALGLEVFVWTVDTPTTMQRLIDMGVDGIITNRPDRLRSLLSEK